MTDHHSGQQTKVQPFGGEIVPKEYPVFLIERGDSSCRAGEMPRLSSVKIKKDPPSHYAFTLCGEFFLKSA